jgi:hypothetical protein
MTRKNEFIGTFRLPAIPKDLVLKRGIVLKRGNLLQTRNAYRNEEAPMNWNGRIKNME